MPLTEAQQQIARDFARHLASNFRTPAVRSIVTSKNREILPCTFADLRIRTKDKRLISLEPNYPQAWYLDDLHDRFPSFDWRNGYYSLRGVRDDILKPRQLGFSTILLGLMFLDTTNTPQTESLCMTDNGDRSEKLFRIIHRMYDRLPKHKQRPKKYSSKREIEYSDIDSIISVGTAGTGHVGRGGTISNLLESERAFWENGDEVEAGLFESVPASGNIWKETTANGYNEYYQERAREHTGESNFRPIFFSWASHKEYQMEIEPPFTRTPEEETLAQTHTLSNEQLQWRRQKIRDLNRIPDKPKFDQEYPICLTADARISTNVGMISIADAQDGMFTENGEIVTCWSNLPRPVFKLLTRQGRILRGTAEHPLWLANEKRWEPIGDLKPGQSIELCSPRFAEKASKVEWSPLPALKCSVTMTPHLARFLGYFMGDGCWHAGNLSVVCDANDQDVVCDVARLIRKIFDVDAIPRTISRVQGRAGAIDLRAGITSAFDFMNSLGLLRQAEHAMKAKAIGGLPTGAYKRRVHVPDCIWQSTKSHVSEFLKGLFESDGSVTPQGIVRFGTCHLQFARDIQYLLLGFGINATIQVNFKKGGSRKDYEQYLLALGSHGSRLFYEKIGFVSERKRGNRPVETGLGRKPRTDLTDEVVSVEPDGDAVTYNLCVADSHVYTANGILTHNCESVAFLHSGNPYFNREMLDTLQEALRAKEFDPIPDLVFPKIRYPLLRDLYSLGTFRIYCMPRDDHDYIICADPAQGLNADGRHSKNGAHVLDVQTWEQVAVVDGDWTPGMLGMILNELAWYYNEALVGVHRNNHGHTVLRELIYHAPQPGEEKLGYPMQLGEECTGVYTFSHTHIKGTKSPQRAVTREAGFPETERSKIYMLDALRDAIDADPGLVLYDRATVGQLLSYVHLPGGGAGPEAGCAADLVSSLALGAVLLNLNWRKTTRRNRGVGKPFQPLTSGMGKERIR